MAYETLGRVDRLAIPQENSRCSLQRKYEQARVVKIIESSSGHDSSMGLA